MRRPSRSRAAVRSRARSDRDFPPRRSRLSRRGRIPRRSYGTLRSSSRQGGRPSARAGIVPYERLFVRSNLPTPDASVVDDRDGWQLAVEGVRNPGTLTLRELKTLGVETVAAVLQCSGNGRIFFPHGARGAQWGVGAAGCVVWSGVPVRSVAEALGGVEPGARFTTGDGWGGDPRGTRPRRCGRGAVGPPREGDGGCAPGLGDERRASPARAWRPASARRARVLRHQPGEVPRAARLHADGEQRRDHADRVPVPRGGGGGRSGPADDVGDGRQVLDQPPVRGGRDGPAGGPGRRSRGSRSAARERSAGWRYR